MDGVLAAVHIMQCSQEARQVLYCHWTYHRVAVGDVRWAEPKAIAACASSEISDPRFHGDSRRSTRSRNKLSEVWCLRTPPVTIYVQQAGKKGHVSNTITVVRPHHNSMFLGCLEVALTLSTGTHPPHRPQLFHHTWPVQLSQPTH